MSHPSNFVTEETLLQCGKTFSFSWVVGLLTEEVGSCIYNECSVFLVLRMQSVPHTRLVKP